MLEELVLTVINKELMLRGEAASQEKGLRAMQKSRLTAIKNQISDLKRKWEQTQVSKDRAYEEYVTGGMTPDEYRNGADELKQQAELLAGQIYDRQKVFWALEEELERLNIDMKQIIRYSHMEELTQELIDTFIERIYVYRDKRVEIEWKFRED